MSKLKRQSVYLKIATVEVNKSCGLNVIRVDSNPVTGYKLTGPCFELQPNQGCTIECAPSKHTGPPARSQNRFSEVTINMSPANTINEYITNTSDVIEISRVQTFLINKSRFDIGLVETETSYHSQVHPHVTVEHPVNNSGGQNTRTAVTNCSVQKVQLCFFRPEQVEQKNKLPPTTQILSDDVLTSTMLQSISEKNFAQESNRVWPNLCGLENLGNTCYMNSALQCLVHTEPLRKLFLNNTTHQKKGTLCYHYGLLTKEMWCGATQVVNPRHLKDAITNITSEFSNSTQEDAQEFIMWLLSGLHDELKIAMGTEHENMHMVSKPKPSGQSSILDLESAENWWTACKKAENSRIFDIFYCQLQTEVVTCQNCHKATKFQAESQLTLPLPNFNVANQKRKHTIAHDGYTHNVQKQKRNEENQHPRGSYYEQMAVDSLSQQYCTVADCLKVFTSTKEISSWYYCGECKSSVYGGNVTTVIWKLGNVVIIHLNRFDETSSGWTKSDVKIFNNLSITFGPEHAKYDLYAVISHEGSTSTSGHYYAIIKHEDNWFYMNDSNIDYIPKSNLDNMMSNACVLFYQRKETEYYISL